MEELEEWLTINLVTHLVKLNYQDVYYYFHPCLGLRREKRNINQQKLLEAIKLLQSKDIIINNYYAFETKDVIDYLQEYVELIHPEFLIINSLNSLIKKSSYLDKEVLKKLEQVTKNNKTKIIIWANLSDIQLANINKFAIIKEVISLKRVKSNPFLIEGTYYENKNLPLKLYVKYNKNLCCLEEVNASKGVKK